MSASEDTKSKRPLRDGIDDARGQAGDIAAGAKKAAGSALERGREQAASLGSIEENPLVALIGGIAIGAAIGALIPRTEREAQLYGSVGDRLTEAAKGAAGAARDASKGKLAELGFSRDNAQSTLRSVVDAAIAAATSAGTAAVDAAKDKTDEALKKGGKKADSANDDG